MAYVRSKMIHGNGPYYYLVKSERVGTKVKQTHIAYLGKNAGQKSGTATAATLKSVEGKTINTTYDIPDDREKSQETQKMENKNQKSEIDWTEKQELSGNDYEGRSAYVKRWRAHYSVGGDAQTDTQPSYIADGMIYKAEWKEGERKVEVKISQYMSKYKYVGGRWVNGYAWTATVGLPGHRQEISGRAKTLDEAKTQCTQAMHRGE